MTLRRCKLSKKTIAIFIFLFTLVLGITTATSHYFVHPPPGTYLGNSNSHIVHTINCSSGAKIKDENRVYFNSITEALSKNYRPCKVCNPK